MSSCLHPVYLTNPHWNKFTSLGKRNLALWRAMNPGKIYPDDYKIFVPCGKCLGCRKDRARQWRVRLLHEHMFGKHFNCICLTLTIDNDNYAKFSDKAGIKACLRAFLDRLRYYTSSRKLPKRFFVTELGEERDRLHFHGFMWDIDIPYDKIRRCWSYGFIWIDKLKSVKQLSYATKYITKPSFKFHYPLVFVSPGLGADYLKQRNWQDWHRKDPDYFLRMHCTFNGWTYSLPHYYRRKMFSTAEILRHKLLLSKHERPFKKFFLGRSYVDARQYATDRDKMYETTVRTSKTRVVKRIHYLPFNIKSNGNFPEIGGQTS